MSRPLVPAVPNHAAPLVNHQLHRLRQQLRRAFGAAADAQPLSTLTTGWPTLDALLVGGGLPRGRLTALAGPGATGLLQQVVAGVTRTGTVAWLDPSGRLEATALQAAGVDLAELLVMQPPTERALLRAATVFQRTGAVDLLVVDAPHLTPHATQRLATLARLGATSLLLLATSPAGLGATADLLLTVTRTAWQQDTTGLHGCELVVGVARQRGGPAGARLTLALPFAVALPPLDGLPRRVAPTAQSTRERHGTG